MEWLTKLLGEAGSGLAGLFGMGGPVVDPGVISESVIDSTSLIPDAAGSLTQSALGNSPYAPAELLSTNYATNGLANSFANSGMPYSANGASNLIDGINSNIMSNSIVDPTNLVQEGVDSSTGLASRALGLGKDTMGFFKNNKDAIGAMGALGKVGYDMYSGNRAAKMTQGVIDRRNADSDKAAAERESFMTANNAAWKKFNEQEAQKNQAR